MKNKRNQKPVVWSYPKKGYSDPLTEVPRWLVFVTIGLILALFCYVVLIAVARAEEIDISNAEQPEEPSYVVPAPPFYCPNGNGWVPTCNPVNDPVCWDPCGETRVSFGDVYWKDGQKYWVHWLACGQTVAEQQQVIEQLKRQLAKKIRRSK